MVGGWVTVAAKLAHTQPQFDRLVGWATILAVPVGAVGVALVVFEKASRRSPAPSDVVQPLVQALADLAATLRSDWGQEAVLREVTRPAPVLVSWSSTGRRSADRPVVLDEAGTDWRQLPLRGQLDGLNQAIVDAFRALPHRQLMVLGQPGAGKSVFAILLTLGLIDHPGQGEPLPVLLPINVWDPEESVEDFVARRVAEDYTPVLAPHGDPPGLARQLVTNRLLLPILDGLDELPSDAHARAVGRLDEYASSGRPLVVTCRSREYEQAVVRGRVLSRAAVIELEPVSVEAAIGYLSQPTADPRWTPVFVELRHHHDGLLAKVLSTPLMVAMARTAYQDPRSRPSDLLTLTTTELITGRLMDAFLTAAYTRSLAASGGRSADRYSPGQARRWLTTLAFHLYQAGTRDLHWWQIKPGLLSDRPARSRVITIAAAPVIVAAVAAAAGAAAGAGWGTARAATAATMAMLIGSSGWLRPLWPNGCPPYVPTSFRTPQQQRRIRWAGMSGYSLGCGVLTGLVTTAWSTALTAGVICAVLTVPLPLWHLRSLPRRDVQTRSLPVNHDQATAAAIQYGVISGAVYTIAARLTHAGPGLPLVAATVYAAVAALAAGEWTWIRFRLAYARLCWNRQLPPRLWPFLDDAHQRGVLRRTGTVYQFRHALLQDRLASPLVLQHLRALVRAGIPSAAGRLADMLDRQGLVEEAIAVLQARADAGDQSTADRLADLLARQGRVEELRARADAGDQYAAGRLAHLLARQGRVEELRARADAGDQYAAGRLADLLDRQGRLEEAIAVLQARADAGDQYAAGRLADLLDRQGRLEEAIAVLQARADAGNWLAALGLNKLLVRQGRVEELQARADAGDRSAAESLADLLDRQGRLEEAIAVLQARADAGDQSTADRLADLLARQGRVEELQARADAGDQYAAVSLADLFDRQGRVEEAIAVLQARADVYPAGRRGAPDVRAAADRLADLLARQGRVEELQARADAGDQYAAVSLADLFDRQGRVEEAIAVLQARADVYPADRRGAPDVRAAADRLADLLARQGRVEELQARADAGDQSAADRLADLPDGQGLDDRLTAIARAWIDALVAGRYASLPDVGRHIEQAITVLRYLADDDESAAEQLASLLARQGRVEELQARADVGDRFAVDQLADILARQEGKERPVPAVPEAFISTTPDPDQQASRSEQPDD